MISLLELGMKKDWLYEVIITSCEGHIPHAAPFGVKTENLKSLLVEMYRGSNTLRNILTRKEFVLNLVGDPVHFYNALYEPENLSFGSVEMIHSPILKNAWAHIEARIVKTERRKDTVLIEAEIAYVHIQNRGGLINRANGLFLESLIISTRIPYLPKGRGAEILKENYRVINKTAPGSHYEAMMRKLLDRCGDR